MYSVCIRLALLQHVNMTLDRGLCFPSRVSDRELNTPNEAVVFVLFAASVN